MPPLAPPDPDGSARIRVMDIGGSHVATGIVAVGPAPGILERTIAPLDPHGRRDELLGAIGAAAARLPDGPEPWTVAIPGPFDYARGSGTFAGMAKFEAIAGLDLRAAFSELLGVPGERIVFVNDATAYGAGEWWASPQPRAERFVCLTLGTGVGSVFLDAGRPVESGPEVPPHGWVDTLTVDGAPLEDAVSTRAIRRRWAALTGEDVSVREIAERARAGDERAAGLLDVAMVQLGTALAPWLRSFRATEVVVGGSMVRSWDLLGPGLARGVAAEVRLRPARLVDDAPLLGAAMLGIGLLQPALQDFSISGYRYQALGGDPAAARTTRGTRTTRNT